MIGEDALQPDIPTRTSIRRPRGSSRVYDGEFEQYVDVGEGWRTIASRPRIGRREKNDQHADDLSVRLESGWQRQRRRHEIATMTRRPRSPI